MNQFATETELIEYLSTLPVSDRWLDDDLLAKSIVEKGLKSVATTPPKYIGSFAKYVSENDDSENEVK